MFEMEDIVIPNQDMVQTEPRLQPYFGYPIINCGANDAYYEMILGADVIGQLPEGAEKLLAQRNAHLSPTPGPAYKPQLAVRFTLELKFAELSLIPKLNEFLEYCCKKSDAIKRLALNKVTRQLIVVFRLLLWCEERC